MADDHQPGPFRARHNPVFLLIPATLVYLALPYAIFFAGWLRWPWALGALALLGIGTGLAIREYGRYPITLPTGSSSSTTYRIGLILTVLATSLILVGLSGIGGFGFQNFDWSKHNLVLQDLIERSWPVRYVFFGKPVALVYYVAYYLPAASVGKLAGWAVANLALFLWSWAGMLLVLGWFITLVRRSQFGALLIFVLFSGLDAVGSLLTRQPIAQIWPLEEWPPFWTLWTNLDGWAARWQYNANVKLLFSVPNQALAGWLAAGLVLYTVLYGNSRRSVIFVWALTALWSPFVTIGLLPFFVGDFFLRPLPWRARIRGYLSPANLIGALLFLLMVVFYAGKQATIIALLDGEFRNTFLYAEIDGLFDQVRWSILLLLFWWLEIGIFGALIFRSDVFESSRTRKLFVITLVWLSILPFYIFGQVNDLGMRASIPALFFLGVLVARSILTPGLGRALRAVWIGVIAIAALNPIQDIAYHVVSTAGRDQVQEFKLKERWQDIATRFESNPERLRQYVSSEETLFFALLAREADAELPGAGARHLLFADSVMVLDPWLKSQVMAGGEELAFQLKLRPIKMTDENVSLAARLVGEGESAIWVDQQWPGGWPTSRWQPYGTYYDSRTLTLPPETAPGIYRLEIYFAAAQGNDRLAAYEIPAGTEMGSAVMLGYVVVTDGTPPPVYDPPILFGDEISLVAGDSIEDAQAAPGERLPIRLYWQASRQPGQEYTGFVHLLNEEGELVAQDDHPAAHGVISMHDWEPGVTMPDHYLLQLPTDLAPGSYSVAVGLYNVGDGQRLPARRGEEVLGDNVILGRLMIDAIEP